jgi:hypothetical protein
MRPKLTYANVMATIAVFIALGGASYAATQLPKNSVGAKQLKDGSVTTAKIKEGAVTGSKVGDRSLTGSDINTSTLNNVPSATHASSADSAASATHATTADKATTADSATVANGMAAPEPFHEVNTPGQPPFEPGCKNLGAPRETVAFFKDHEGIVHLKGEFNACTTFDVFTLPAGYRPAPGMIQEFFGTNVSVYGPGVSPGFDGHVFCSVGVCSLDGITFRAES